MSRWPLKQIFNCSYIHTYIYIYIYMAVFLYIRQKKRQKHTDLEKKYNARRLKALTLTKFYCISVLRAHLYIVIIIEILLCTLRTNISYFLYRLYSTIKLPESLLNFVVQTNVNRNVEGHSS